MTFLALEGTGATIQFLGSDFTSDLINLVLSERAREHIETTHLGAIAAKTFRPGELVDLGTVRATFDHQPGEVLLVGAPAQQIVIKYPDTAERSFDPLVLYGAVVAQGGQRLWIDNSIVTAVTIRLMVPDVVTVVSIDPPVVPVVLAEAELWGFDDFQIGESGTATRVLDRPIFSPTVT